MVYSLNLSTDVYMNIYMEQSMNEKKNVYFITGAAGFIGFYLSKRLL